MLEKIMKGLESCATRHYCGECPYFQVDDKDADCITKLMRDVMELLKDQPQIVRCMDCKHYLLPDGETRGECRARAGWFPVDDDFFCADGEMKDDG